MSITNDIREAADQAYAAWRAHVDSCEQCGDALAPCRTEPRLWSAYTAAKGGVS